MTGQKDTIPREDNPYGLRQQSQTTTIMRKDTVKKSDKIMSEGGGGASSDFYEPDFEDQTSNSQNVKGVLSSIG